MVVVDNTFLTLLLHPNARPPNDPSGQPITRLRERIDLLIETLEEDDEIIIIPAPVLTEFLVLAENDGPQYLAEIDKNILYQVKPFDEMAAVELAAIHLHVRTTGGGRRGGQEGTYAKITFDRQIVTIARVNGVSTIYSDDEGVKKFAERYGITVVQTWELPLPPEKEPLLACLLEEEGKVPTEFQEGLKELAEAEIKEAESEKESDEQNGEQNKETSA